MRKDKLMVAAAWLLAVASLALPLSAFAQQKTPAPLKLKVGDMAPDFKLQYFDGTGLKDISLDQFRGKQNVIVAFYVFAFTGG
jgi:cytochrome oxidase Cu insertion factor (SCO1/SenC/PrrC family)